MGTISKCIVRSYNIALREADRRPHGCTLGRRNVRIVPPFFRSARHNRFERGYTTSEGVPPELLSQFPILEEALEAMGVVVWPMVHYEADDALASAADKAAEGPGECVLHLLRYGCAYIPKDRGR